jgi:PAS domain S-box-containing protein
MAERMDGLKKAKASEGAKAGTAPAGRKAGSGESPDVLPGEEAEYRALVERLPIGVCRLAPDGRLLMANSAMLRIMGAESFEELARQGRGGWLFGTDHGLEGLDERLAGKGEVRGLESTWTVRSAPIKVRQNLRAVRDPDGRITCYEGTVEDVTERKKAEESLRAKADFLEEVVTNATVGIFVIDEDNKYVLINPECGRIVGHWPDDWTGREAGLQVHPEDQAKAMAHFIQAVSGEQNDFEIRIEASDGSYKHCRINLSPMMLGERAHVLGVVSDITERKNAEEALTEKRSHDLNLILVGALTQMALRMPQAALEGSMKDFERWFGERFERRFEEDMELISAYETPGEKPLEGPELVVRRYLRFYSSILTIYGVRTECTHGPSSSIFEILNCAWLPEAEQSPVPCRICRTILCGSYDWTGLEGSAEQTGTIAGGSRTCRFVCKPGPPRRRAVNNPQ